MNNNLKTKNTTRLNSYALGVSVLWSLLIAISLLWHIEIEKSGTLDAARIEARTAFEKDVIYRRWNAGHGGVYVPSNQKTQPNPYLDVPERDIITPLGIKLTKVNPAYMTRQIHEMAMQLYGVKGHITSLNPIRPANAPDFWESDALKSFQAGEKEVSSVEKMEGKDYMRLMRPLLTESGCLKCHAVQGYKLGDVRGGISVAVPMAPLQVIERFHIIKFSTILGLLWIVGLTGIGFSSHHLSQQLHKRKQTEEKLQESEKKFRAIFEQAAVGVALTSTRTGELIQINRKYCDIVGHSFDYLKSINFREITHPDDLQADLDKMQELMEGKIPDFSIEKRYFRPDGSTVWVNLTVSPMWKTGGQLTQHIAVIEDITKRKVMEAEVKTLSGLLPICASCKKIRDDKGYWNQIESYIHKHSEAEFSHGICPECMDINPANKYSKYCLNCAM